MHNNLGGDYSKIIIGGFSQGAAVALYVAAKLKAEKYSDWFDSEVSRSISSGSSSSTKSRRARENSSNSTDSQEEFEFDQHYTKANRDRFKDLKSIKNTSSESTDNEEGKCVDTSVGAVIFWSGFHLFDKPEKEIFRNNKFPIFVYHGVFDEMIDCDYSLRPFMKLLKKHKDIEINTEEIGHMVSFDEWFQIQNFIHNICWK